MKMKNIIPAFFFLLVIGCTKEEGWFGSGHVSFSEPKQIGENHFVFVVKVASANTREDLIEAFHWKARQICECSEYESELKIEPYQYSSYEYAYFFTYDALRAVGTVKWENAGNNEAD